MRVNVLEQETKCTDVQKSEGKNTEFGNLLATFSEIEEHNSRPFLTKVPCISDGWAPLTLLQIAKQYLAATRQVALSFTALRLAGELIIYQLMVGPERMFDAAYAGDHVAGTEIELHRHPLWVAQGNPRVSTHKPPVFIQVVKV